MKILVVTNLYPPHYRGGYEVRCAQVAEALQHAGHDVRVLTSVYGLPLSGSRRIRPTTERVNGVVVHRHLHQYGWPPYGPSRPWTFTQAHRELSDARQFLGVVGSFRPDIINWWSMYGLSKLPLVFPRPLGIPDVHWVEHAWMIEDGYHVGPSASRFWLRVWHGTWGPSALRPFLRILGAAWERRVKRQGIPTRHFPNDPRHVCFVSKFMRSLHEEAGLGFHSSEVIYGGVPTAPFYQPLPRAQSADKVRLLYASQITPDRGLHTLIEALDRVPPAPRAHLTLTVAGATSEVYRDYLERIKARVSALRLEAIVSFIGQIPHTDMPGLFKQHDVLVFPSTRSEGLPLIIVEAMLAGCAVVTTRSGGAQEIADLAALPTFPKDDPDSLGQLITRLITDQSVVPRVALRGQQGAVREFSFERMMQQFTATLHRLHADATTSAPIAV